MKNVTKLNRRKTRCSQTASNSKKCGFGGDGIRFYIRHTYPNNSRVIGSKV
nr:MAG TPA: hypothetical protein [Caudoviricetes sp.]